MYNEYILTELKTKLPSYREVYVKNFYDTCSTNHSRLAYDIVESMQAHKFEGEYLLSYNYIVPKPFFYKYINLETTEEGLPICINFISAENNEYVLINLEESKLQITINTLYIKDGYLSLYINSIKTKMMLLEYCIRCNIHIDNNNLYINNLNNDIELDETDFLFILNMLLLISPSEKESRYSRMRYDIDSITTDNIDQICYSKHGLDRICKLIDYFLEDNYYNYFLFLLDYFLEYDEYNLKKLLYLGYYLTKLNIHDFKIDLEYVNKIKGHNYIFTRFDKKLVKEIYNYLDEYFNDYLYDIFVIIDTVLSEKYDN